MNQNELYPLGVRRDSSYYTRINWASTTERDPRLWVLNIIDDDILRDGGTWGANDENSANVVLDFFGETQKVSKIKIYKNVGIAISVLEELAREINIYSCKDDTPAQKLRTAEDDIDSVDWVLQGTMKIVKEEGWQEIVFEEPFDAKFIRIETKDNFCKRDESFIPWIEFSEVKIYG
ncbi:MAG: hypothetical protein E7408_07650 [Ruminococcaceae bacterium]|nr:hypothetical protein [Oscillospiraceae bacterium]